MLLPGRHPARVAGRTTLVVVLGELVQTTTGKWITHPHDVLPERTHASDAGQVHSRFTKPASGTAGGHTTWTCRTCNQTGVTGRRLPAQAAGTGKSASK